MGFEFLQKHLVLRDEKGVSPIVGFILILTILVLFLSFLQTVRVPEVCKEVEADHIKEATGQLMELSDQLMELESSSTRTTKFDLGVNYPEFLFLTAPESTATTMSAEEFEVTAEFTEILPNGTKVERTMNFTSSRIKLSPHYLFYPQDSLILENTAVFKHASDNYIPLSHQSAFRNGIKFEIINTTFKSVSTDQPLTIVSVPLSAGGYFMATDISISFESAYPDYWRSIGYNVTVDGDQVTVASNDTVPLSFNKVVLCSGDQAISRNPDPAEIIKINSINNFSLKSGETISLGVKVLDEYGNPVEGVKVEVNSSAGDVTPSTLYTDSEGEVRTTFEAKKGEGEITFSTSFGSASYNVNVKPLSCEVFDVSWIAGSSCDWKVNDSLTRNYGVRVEYQSQPVNGSTVDFSTDSDIITLLDNENITTDGITSVEVRAVENGSARLFATCGGSTDILNLTIMGAGTGSLFVSDVVAEDGPDTPFVDRPGGVEFLITNNHGETVTIDKIEIDPIDNHIDKLDDQVTPNDQPKRTEIYAQSDVDAYSDFGGGISIPNDGISVDIGHDGQYNSGNSPRVNSGNTMRFYLYEFFDGYENIDMEGKDIQITLTYTVGGGTKTKTFTVTPQ